MESQLFVGVFLPNNGSALGGNNNVDRDYK